MSLSAPTPSESSGGLGIEAKSAEGAGLTLMRLGLWTEEMRLKMRLMAMVVDDAKGERTRPKHQYRSKLTDVDWLVRIAWRCFGIAHPLTYKPWRSSRPEVHGPDPRRGASDIASLSQYPDHL